MSAFTMETLREAQQRIIGLDPATAPALTVIVSPFATENVGMSFEPIPMSRHRSKRIWKKLAKRVRRTARPINRPCAYRMGDKMIVHPAIKQALKHMYD